jgi:L-serine dehydratase
MRTSLFDLFKIGIGPSSSHTVGPMIAARRFALGLVESGLRARTSRVEVELFGSLALTGRGHQTDRAVLLGLCGEQPDLVDPESVEPRISAIQREGRLSLLGGRDVAFDVTFRTDKALPRHPNALCFSALEGDQPLHHEIWYSIGGGFVVREDESAGSGWRVAVPHPFGSAAELLEQCERERVDIPELMRRNERVWRSESEISSGILRIWEAMRACTERGLRTEGMLPGGLNVHRRAPALYRRLTAGGAQPDGLSAMDWLNLYAMAVNEENAAGGRVVTAPTNGAAGVIPAVAHYYLNLLNGDVEGIERYLLAAAAIGVLYAENASISGAEVGCQGEVGVACSMAAAGLAAVLGGNNQQMEHAAEIAMEHNLGMTCDPIGGLVQIPCIERNAFGAVKAVNAARMAMRDTGQHKVSLDQVIRTMHQTGLDMQSKYKETSLAGLAVNVVEC